MNVNWDKWVIEQLPRALRTTLMYVFCMVFTGPVRMLHTKFGLWKKSMLVKAGGSPQVCMLKKLIYDELGILVEIEEGNGKPVDFIIRTAFSNIDKERQLFALLDKYKLAGKSYGYENAEVKFSYEWSGYVCEQRTVFVQWGGFVCERKYRPTNHIKCNVTGSRITVTPEFAPTSELKITFEVSGMDEEWNSFHYEASVILSKNSSDPVIGTWQYDVSPIVAGTNIREDDNYIYEIQWV